MNVLQGNSCQELLALTPGCFRQAPGVLQQIIANRAHFLIPVDTARYIFESVFQAQGMPLRGPRFRG